MVDAIVGGVIMVVATTSLFLAIDVAERAMNSAGRFCLTEDEKIVLARAGLPRSDELAFWSQNLLISILIWKRGKISKSR